MKGLFVSAHFPRDFRQSTTGTFKRMRMFLQALQEKASVRLLFYCAPELDDKRIAETTAALISEWNLDGHELLVCREELDPEHTDKLWDGYLARGLSMHRQLGFVSTSGEAQLRAFEACLEGSPDFVFVHRLSTMCPVLMTKRPLPPVFMDLDDVEHKAFLRNLSQQPKRLAKRLFYLQWPALLWGERRAIKLTRKTFVCSELDAEYLSKWGLSNIGVIPNSISIPNVQPLVTEPVLLYLGGYGYKPNAVAAEQLVTRIWPAVRDACPTAKLVIAGGNAEFIPCFGQPHDGVEYTGFVDDLDALYRGARVVCCPIRSGGGTRIKIIEAAAYGKPIVSTHLGAEGLNFADGREILLRDDMKAFAEACIQLLRNYELCKKLGQAARAKAVERYNQQNVLRMIQSEILGYLDPHNKS